MSNDGIVIVLDFTQPEWPDASREKLKYSHRSTTSSRRPGRAIEGTVVSFTRKLVTCPDCGRKRIDLDGPHSLVNIGDERQRDCIGRVYHHGEQVK